jgi:hypothetical protein
MHPKEILHPQGPQGCYTQWVKEANPGVVLKHKQCRDITTSESETLNLEALSLGSIYRSPKIILEKSSVALNKLNERSKNR